MKEIVVRWGSLEDEGEISRVLRLNSMPGQNVLMETYIIAEERGEILAVGRCLLAHKRLVLGPLAVDPWAGEHRFAAALYSGAGRLAQEMGLQEVWADCDEHREYLLEAGYRRRVDGWRLDTTRSLNEYQRLPERGWRKILSLWSATHVPFFRAFRA
jgi:N-acetylglutamate synthase-like GNAT family acetyltransferase